MMATRPLRQLARRGTTVMRLLDHQMMMFFCSDQPFYVISHERSGTHFLINTILKNAFVRQNHHNIGEWFGPYDDQVHRFDHIDAINTGWSELGKQVSIVKSHCDRDLFEARYKRSKIIYVLRDPRDVLVSFFHYLNTEEFHHFNPSAGDHRCRSFSEFLRRPISPFLRFGFSLNGDFSNVAERWATHVGGWAGSPDILLVRYEDLHADYEAVVRRVAVYLGLRLRPWRQKVRLHDAPTVLPRKGIVGDWKNVFDGSDVAFLQSVLEEYGIDWNWATSEGERS